MKSLFVLFSCLYLLPVWAHDHHSPQAAEPPLVNTAARATSDPYISTGTTVWRYLDNNVDPAAGADHLLIWTTPDFDDNDWNTAQGSFGAKHGELAPVGPYLPNTLLTHYIEGTTTAIPTYFFRTEFDFNIDDLENISALVGEVIYDDGLIIYLNGQKVAGFHDDRVTDETTNLQYAGSGRADPLTGLFEIDPSILHNGANTIAVALYQDRASSSDIYFDFASLAAVKATPSRVILTPTETTATSQSFSWLAGSQSHTEGYIEIRPADEGQVQTFQAYDAGQVNNNPRRHFSVTVAGLQAATWYEYRVGLPDLWSDWYSFRTADPIETDFTFFYYGDAQIGLDSTWPAVVAMAQSTAPHAAGSVHAGDLIDTASDETQWTNWFIGMSTAAATTNVLAAPGNHEYSGDYLLRSWKAHFEYPLNQPTRHTIGELADLAVGDDPVARQYAAYFDHWTELAAETVYYSDYQGVRFITLNATQNTGFLTPQDLPACSGADCPSHSVGELWIRYQAAWLDHVLATSEQTWNVVTFHQPVYSASTGRNEPILRAHWVPVFQQRNIDLVLMGHDHTYVRGYNNDDATDYPGVTAGPVYVVSNSGAKHYTLAPEDDNVWVNNNATQVLRGEKITTYQVVDVTANTIGYRSYIAEKASGATTDLPVGAVYDEFTITRDAYGCKWVTEVGVEVPSGGCGLDAAIIAVAPEQLAATVEWGQATAAGLDISNVGNLDLTWTLNDEDTGEGPAANCQLAQWLSVEPASGQVPAGDAAQTVTVDIDSAGLEPGEHTGTICIDSNDPGSPTVAVPVTVIVNPPGTLEGTVLSLGHCNANPQPLAGVSVDISSAPGPVTTDEAGFFSVHLPAGEVTIDVSTQDHQSASAYVDLAAGVTVVQDFGLLLDASCARLSRDQLALTLDAGASGRGSVGVSNAHGNNTLDWQFDTVNRASWDGDPARAVFVSVTAGALDCANPAGVPWLHTDPLFGQTLAGAESIVDLLLDATDLSPGVYEAGLCLFSNDPFHPALSLPVTLTVRGAPDPTPGMLLIDPKVHDFGEVKVDDSDSVIVTIGNNAAESNALVLETIVLDGEGFTINGGGCGISTVLEAGVRCDLEIIFSPDAEGEIGGALTVRTEDGQTEVVVLSGTGTEGDPGDSAIFSDRFETLTPN